jgi:hypothetical protein
MGIFRPPVTNNQEGSAWGRIENHGNEERPLQTIGKIVVKGSVDVVFRRSDKPMLIVAGEATEAVDSVKTYFNGGKLVIERDGMTINFGNSRMTFHGSVGSFVMGDIVNGRPMGTSISQGKVVVCVALLEAPAVKIKGSGDVTLLDLRQAGLDLEIDGSGDITAYGQVAHLEVEIAGSSDILVRGNPPHRDHSVAGSGMIKFR